MKVLRLATDGTITLTTSRIVKRQIWRLILHQSRTKTSQNRYIVGIVEVEILTIADNIRIFNVIFGVTSFDAHTTVLKW